MTTYEVGQVLFIFGNKKMSITPVQVIEQVVKRTRVGEEISYVVSMTSDASISQPLSALDGDVFTDLETVKKVMKRNADAAIESMVNKAKENSLIFGAQKEVKHDVTNEQTDIETSGVLVELPDGTLARFKQPVIQ